MPSVKIGDKLIEHEKFQQMFWKRGIIEEAVRESDRHIRVAAMGIPKTNLLIKVYRNLLNPDKYIDNGNIKPAAFNSQYNQPLVITSVISH